MKFIDKKPVKIYMSRANTFIYIINMLSKLFWLLSVP